MVNPESTRQHRDNSGHNLVAIVTLLTVRLHGGDSTLIEILRQFGSCSHGLYPALLYSRPYEKT